MDRYYVVQTQPLRERLAAQELRHQNFETFFPQLKHAPRVRQARLVVPPPSPLFPKYLFVKLDLSRDHWRSINGTRGVVRLMGMNGGESPSAIPHHVMNRLLEAGELLEAETADLPFKAKDPVEFVKGPMTGVRGIVTMCETARVVLLLSMLGGQREVRCHPRDLKYVSSAVTP